MENLEGLVAAMGLPLSALAGAVSLIRLVRAGGREASATGALLALPAAEFLPWPAAEFARNLARFVEDQLGGGGGRPADPRTAEPEEARRLAHGLWQRLGGYGAGERRALVRESPEFQGWALCERACHESEAAAAHDARAAVALGAVAVRIAVQAEIEEGWRRRLEGYARAFLANAVRVAGRLAAADRIFTHALEVWESGAPTHPEPLDATRLLDLEASLRRNQRRLGEALDRLDRALAATPPGAAAARLLLKRAKTLEELGDYEGAVEALRRAAPWIGPEGDPRLPLILEFNLAWDLCQLGRAAEAEGLLAGVRRLAGRLGNRLDLVRLRWLEGHVAAGLGRVGEAAAAFAEVRREFAALQNPYDGALATLHLAVLYATEGGHAVEVKALAAEAVAGFEAAEVEVEARRALGVFRVAAEEERVTVEMARAVVELVERVRREPGARFEGGG